MKLARLEDSSGSSRGFWATRGLPGGVLWHDQDGWRVVCSPILFTDLEYELAERLWGEDWKEQIEASQELIDNLTGTAFKTRSEALHAIESLLVSAPEPVLSEVL